MKNIKIIVYSQTNNTLSVAQKLKDALAAQNCPVQIERLRVQDEKEFDPNKIVITHRPTINPTDVVIIATPVHAFNPAPASKAYVDTLDNLKDITTLVFVTHHFPFKWLGGSRSVRILQKKLRAKNANVIETQASVIDWSNKKRNDEIDALITEFTQLLLSM